MTLALYGKSKRRQGGLILAGFVALLLALIGGLGARAELQAAGDPEPPQSDTVNLTAGSRYQLIWTGYQPNQPAGKTTYTYQLKFQEWLGIWWETNDEEKLSHWVIGNVCGAPNSVHSLTKSGGGTIDGYAASNPPMNVPGFKVDSDAAPFFGQTYTLVMNGVYGVQEDGFSGTFWQAGANKGTAKVPGPDCETVVPKVDLKVCKYYEGDSNSTLTFGIQTSWGQETRNFDAKVKKSDREDCKTYEVPAETNITIDETSFPNGWNNAAGYPKYNLDGGQYASLGDGVTIQVEPGSCVVGGSQQSATRTDDGPDCTVTIKNKYAPPAWDATVCKLLVGNNDGDALTNQQFGFTVAGTGVNEAFAITVDEYLPNSNGTLPGDITPPFDGGSPIKCQTVQIPGDVSEVYATETTQPAGWINGSAGSGQYYPAKYDGDWTWSNNANNNPPLSDKLTKSKPWVVFKNKGSLPKGDIVVKKVKDTTPGVPAADGSNFSGNVDGSIAWGPITFGGNTPNISVAPGNHAVAETGTENGWTPVGYKIYTNSSSTATCSTDKADYDDNNLSVPVTEGQTTLVCVMNTKAPIVVDPTVSKVKPNPGEMTPGGLAYWLINIDNTANDFSEVTVYIEDEGATYVDVTNGTCSDSTFDSNGIICTANADAIMSIKVSKPAPAEACERQSVNNSASIWFGTDKSGKSRGTVGGTNDTKYDIGADTSLCGKPGITKTHTGPTSTSNPNDVSWTVQVINPETGTGIARVVRIKDSNVEVISGPTFGGGADCDPNSGQDDFETQLNDSDGVVCDMPASSSITFVVKPAGTIARTCNDQVFKNTAYLYLGDSTDPIDSAAGPDLTLTKDLTSCEVKVTFSKYICQEYSDVPRNEGPGGQNDIGKNDGPNGLTQANLGPKGPADNDAAVNLGNDGEGPSCALATTPWTFNIFTTNRVNGSGGTLLQTFAITGSQEITLNANALAETLKGSGAYVEEVYQAGYGFGALKCYTDHLNDDNWEWLNFQSGIPTGAVHCIAYNVPATRDLQICKVVVGNGDGVVRGAFDWKFDVRPTGKSNIVVTNSVAEPAGEEGTESTPVCKTVKVPSNLSFDVVEWMSRPAANGNVPAWVDANGYPQYLIGVSGTLISNNTTTKIAAGTEPVKVTFYNKERPLDKQIIIEKRFIDLPVGYLPNPETDYPTIEISDSDYPNVTFANNCSWVTNNTPNHVFAVCTVPFDWDGTINETPPPGWVQVRCFAPEVDEQRVEAITVAEPNEIFCNAPFGTVIVNKLNTSASGPNFEAIISGLPGSDVLGSALDGSPTIAQGSPSNQTYVPLGNTPFSVSEVNAGTVETCGSGATNYFTIVQAPADTVLDTPGEIQEWTIVNQPCGILGQGGIVLQKFRDNNGDGIANGADANIPWTIRITGPNGYDETFNISDEPFLVGGLAPGDYTVMEQAESGWVVIGLRVDNGALVSAATQATVAVDGAENVLRGVTFYNQPRVNIVVVKTIFNNANPNGANGGAGWTLTLSGCGVGPLQATTDATGTASWNNLPPAVGCSYTITETAKAGWIADQISKNTSPDEPGETATVTFINRQLEGCTNINDCGPVTVCDDCNPTPTPTNTPVTPTNTPDPDETPTEEPTATPTTPITDVEGEKTPGPGQPTPIAPDTGVGIGGTSAGMNVLLVIAGLIAISGGLSFIALGRRKS